MQRLHNRIQLLEAEEEKAQKIIEDTKNKVKLILKTRAAAEERHRDQSKQRERNARRQARRHERVLNQ